VLHETDSGDCKRTGLNREDEYPVMSMTNCVNCGSAKDVDAKVCPFCGTSYFDLTDIDLDQRHPCVVRFKFQDKIFQMKAFVGLAEFHFRPDYMDIRSSDGMTIKHLLMRNNISANIEFISVE